MNDEAVSRPAPLASPALPAPLNPEHVKVATELFEAIVSDRSLLLTIPEEDRIRLLKAAGRACIPDAVEKSRLKKSVRRERSFQKQQADREARATTEIRTLRQDAVFSAPRLPSTTQKDAPVRELITPRNCYVCKDEFRKLHFFYDSMCPSCAEFNYAKRFQTADLKGKVALLTGGRVKIGFQTGLMLLRAGARLIVSTRFPIDAAERYAREHDFDEWKHRLHIHGLDLRHAPSVEVFARHLDATHSRLDILINNAAQTVRRPPGFYAHLLEGEQRSISELPAHLRPLLEGHRQCVDAVTPVRGQLPSGVGAGDLAAAWRNTDPALGIHASAALSLVPYALENEGDIERLFPKGKLDADLQQVDLRSVNSWRLTLAEVATAEMLEVHLVNAVAPFILCAKLKGLMLRDQREPRHIVNVSAMEGSFSRGKKTDKHPHTNMAKAALNMLTRTSAQDYAQSGIYMNAADTGWVTDEDPVIHADRKRQEQDFQPPLDIVDGAARVIDPVFSSINTGRFEFGHFYKDYKPAPW